MLEFVHFSGDAGGKDLQTRRKVRSQAMRDFRRRQRAERDAAANKVAGAIPATASNTSSPPPQNRQRATSEGFQPSANRIQNPSACEDKNDMLSCSIGQPTFSVLPLASPSLSSTSSVSPRRPSHGMRRANTVRSYRTQSDGMLGRHAMPRTPSPSMPSLAAQGPNIRKDDPFNSPSQIAQMFAFCRSYMRWLHPGIDPTTAGRLLSDAWNSSQDPMLLAACCLASVGHLDAVQPNRPGGDYTTYRARVLKELSERMRVPSTAVSDETVGTLACLLSFELSKGNSEATTHLRGLSGIVNVKGGVNSLGFDGNLTMMVECLDLIHAALFDTTPLLTNADPGSRAPSPGMDQGDADLFDRISPLLVAEQQDLQQGIQTAHNVKLREVPQLLASASAALRGSSILPTQDFILYKDDPSLLFRDGLDRFGQQSIHGINETDDSHQLARACHLTLVIFYNLAINKVPYRHHSNQRNCQWLCDAVRNIQDSTWQLVPYFRLWILLTGMVASTSQSDKSVFKAHFVRAIFQMGLPDWRRAKHFVMRFLEMKQGLERPSRRVTPPAENQFASPRLSNSQIFPTWILNGGEDQYRSAYSSASSAGDRASTSLAFRSPFLSRAPSPLSFANSAATEPPSLPYQGTPYDDRTVDPFLKFSSAGSEENVFSVPSADESIWQQYDPFVQVNTGLDNMDGPSALWYLR